MRLTNKETGVIKHLRLSLASRKFNACNECALKCAEGCASWIDDNDKPAPSICSGLGIILVDDTEAKQTACTYCIGEDSDTMHGQKGWINIRLDEDNDIIITDGFDAEYVHINYCPMCGRKLR